MTNSLDLESLSKTLSRILDNKADNVAECSGYILQHFSTYGLDYETTLKVFIYGVIQLNKIRTKDVVIRPGFFLDVEQDNNIAFIMGRISDDDLAELDKQLKQTFPEEANAHLERINKEKENPLSDDLFAEYKRLFNFEGLYGVIARGEPVTEEMLKSW